MEKSRDISRRLRALKREFFYHYDTADGVSVPQVVFDNIRNCVVYDFSNHDMFFFPETTCIWYYYIFPMSDT